MPPDDYHATVTTTWEMAFEYARQTPGAAGLLNLCCFLAPDDIPLDVITANAGALPEELAAVVGDELALDDALAALQAYSLVTRMGAMLAMHRLVQTVARDRMGEEQGKIWAEAVVNLLSKAYRFDQHDMTTWPQCGQLLPHVIIAVNLATEWEVDNNQAAFLNNEAGVYLQYYNSLAEAYPYFQQALAIREKTFGLDHPFTALSLNNLGRLLRTLGDLEGARSYYEQALTIRKKKLGLDHPDTASSLNNLGYLIQTTGDLAGAQPYYEQALAIYEKTLGPNHPNTADSLNNLGYLMRALGNLAKAQQYYKRALAIQEKI